MSSAIRFSEPVLFKNARLQLYEIAQQIYSMYTNKGIMPLNVLNRHSKDKEWLQSNAVDFAMLSILPLRKEPLLHILGKLLLYANGWHEFPTN